jgi:uncharacterized protein (UPF0548 family)
MFLSRRPSPQNIDAFLAASRELPLSYDPVGLAGQDPDGYCIDTHDAIIGRGEAAFERAKTALTEWRHFELGWVEIFPPRAPATPGTVVAVLVRHMGFWSINGCRVVYPVGAASGHEFGFAYGTLTNHAERGEEIFTVSLRPETGDVWYGIRAVSSPRAMLARLGYPLTRALQARFRRDSVLAMTRVLR